VTAEADKPGKHENSTSNMGVGNLAAAESGINIHLASTSAAMAPVRYVIDGLSDTAGVRLHLADTSNGINYGDADKGVKLHLADARGPRGGEIAAAEAGLRLHLVDSPFSPERDLGHAQDGMQLYLAEHSLDRGGRRHEPGNGDFEA